MTLDYKAILGDRADGLVLLAYRGSHSHGLYVPPEDEMGTDDVDLMGVVVPPLENYFGLDEWGSRGTKDFWVDQYDVVLYEFRKMISLLCGANPNVLSLLWLKPEFYLEVSDMGYDLLYYKDKFLTKKLYKSFMGYAAAQLHKMERGSSEGYMGEKRKKLVEKFGFDTKNASHCIRLLRMGTEALETGQLNVYRERDRDELLAIKRGEWALEQVKAEAEAWFDLAHKAMDRCKLPEDVDRQWVNDFCRNQLSYHFLRNQNAPSDI